MALNARLTGPRAIGATALVFLALGIVIGYLLTGGAP